MSRITLVVVALLGLCIGQEALAQDQAVTLTNARLRSGPSKTSHLLGVVPAGDVVTLLPHGHKTGYYRVRTQNEQTGWVSQGAIKILDDAEVHHTEPVVPAPADPGAALNVVSGSFDGCALEGNPSPNGSRFEEIKGRNRFKNRSAIPADSDVDPSITLEKILGSGSDDTGRFDEGKAAEITGFVLHVKPGGKAETTNCRKGDPEHRDAHIELTVSPTDTLEIRRVIIEVTPRWRAAMKSAGVDWSITTLQHAIEGKWVKVRGWLFFDSEHVPQAENTNPGGDSNWRATVWELHPVTKLTVIPNPE